MTKNRDLKRRIRRRMRKTGESYTAARRQVRLSPAPQPLTTAGRARMLGAALADDDVERLMVALALDAAPDLEPWQLWAALDHLTERVRLHVAALDTHRERLEALLRAFYGELGFSVPESYGDPRLNLLGHVLETRKGTPAAFAGLLILLGRRCGLSLVPVAFPGHFLVRTRFRTGAGDSVLIDPASGVPVPEQALLDLAMAELDVDRASAVAHLSGGDARSLARRLLTNLGVAYRDRGQDGFGLAVADRLYEISGAASDRCDRGLYLWSLGARRAAIEDVSAYLAISPGAPDASALWAALQRLRSAASTTH